MSVFLAGTHEAGALAGPRRLLEGITVSLSPGDRIGILGPNGAGKSTLLRLLSGTQEPDSGSVTYAPEVSFASLSQQQRLDPALTVKQAVHGNIPDYQWASKPHLRQIDEGILPDIDLETKCGELSGGQERRVALARTLGKDAPILALDEPTNHLDVEGVAWLADYLNNRVGSANGALVVVTHDRWFLDAVCNRIWEVVPGVDPGYGREQIPGHVEEYEGSYAAYVLARMERARQAQVAEEKRQNQLRKELAWLRRGAPARTSKPKFRIDAAEALISDVPPLRDSVELVRLASARLGKRVIELEDVSFSYPGSKRKILNQVTWRLNPGGRVGVIGVNGAGKSTLLGIMSGELTPSAGKVKRGKTVQLATLEQTPEIPGMNPDLRVVEAISQIKERIQWGEQEITAAKLVEKLGFSKERAWTRVSDLSGGEMRRLQIASQLLAEPNVLILDEPTNDLDTDTLAQLEDLLDSFPGTLVVVSHDRYLLQRVTDSQVALLADGTLAALPGGVEQYLQLRATAQKTADAGKGTNANKTSGEDSEATNKQAQKSGAEIYRARKELSATEKKLDKLQQQLKRLDHELSEGAADTSPEGLAHLQKLNQRRGQLVSEAEELEEAWLRLSETLE
ncbi:MAG: ABC-F family ATP-binding cassette domain-containing protein [Varibaculum cambriense]|uniref:ATP-binding cassette domain-containing protein n=1 Tax=Varibaculum cambriense TaxID=184870 RepID=A0AAJ1EWW4_9ACTO|nr:ABC-F family ATP-binding cassette domain-containing protein [Varibaculum cambriense]MBS6753631.1 ABC-F family ATP-binding cassette domain-containing protein [Varibaculum cambriense]MCG4616900.1 ATP-binding cassette domain-containing protein [Varibaculum cambriense]MDU2311224.1 ABC-F family ATP-binding cassette domain-containing protein [Varibaculum cambriense]MDU4027938.1 ABC-F family ATP-binding cassette domain-containing protein [Varibaculum cambriense]